MGYYLSTFCISILFTFLSERGFRKNKNIKGWICGLIGIISLSYLAGIRGASVGTDVSIYVIPHLERFKYFPTLFGFLSNSTIEPGFALLLFLNAKFFATPFFVLFVSQLLVVFPLYLIFYKFRETNSMTLSMILYDFLFYNMSLCIMRQFIATAFFLTGVIIFSDKKLFKFLLIFLSLMFHYSIAVVIIAYFGIKSVRRRGYLAISNFIILLLSLIVMVLLPQLIGIMNRLGLISQQYYTTYLWMQSQNNTDISIIETTLRGFFVLIPFWTSLSFSKDDTYRLNSFYSVFGYLISFAALNSQYLVRVSYSFMFFILFTFPYSVRYFGHTKNNKLLYEAIVFVISFMYWFIVYIQWNNFGTMPFITF